MTTQGETQFQLSPDEIRLGNRISTGKIGKMYIGTFTDETQEVDPNVTVVIKEFSRPLESSLTLDQFQFALKGLFGVDNNRYRWKCSNVQDVVGWFIKPPTFDWEVEKICLVMKYIDDGFDLDILVKRGIQAGKSLEMKKKLDICCGILNGVVFLHSMNDFSRRIDPLKVIVTPEGGTVLSDVGINRLLQLSPKEVSVYEAPWLRKRGDKIDLRDRDAKSDAYSMGVMLYYILNDGVVPDESPLKTFPEVRTDVEGVREKALARAGEKLVGVIKSLCCQTPAVLSEVLKLVQGIRNELLSELAELDYQRGLVFEKQLNRGEMVKCFEHAARNGHLVATVRLAEELKNVNLKRSVHYYEQAAQGGDVKSALFLIDAYSHGLKDNSTGEVVVIPSKLQVFRFTKLAADAGDVESMWTVGWIYENPKGSGMEKFVEKNPQQSFNYHFLAARHGNARAMYNVGWSYAFGDPVERNVEYAVYWLKLAQENGFEKAGELLEKVKQNEMLSMAIPSPSSPNFGDGDSGSLFQYQ